MQPAHRAVHPLIRVPIAILVPLLVALGVSTVALARTSVTKASTAKQAPQRPQPRSAAPVAPNTSTASTSVSNPPAQLSRRAPSLVSHIAHHYVVRKLTDGSNTATCGASCTLRNAINKANATSGVDLITFAKSGTITLNGAYGALNPTTSMIVQGLGPAKTTISGNGCGCVVFDLTNGGTFPAIEIDDVRITKGTSTTGGGVRIGDVAAILDHDLITNNDATGGYGGGINVATSDAQLWLTNSTVSANTADWGAGITFYYGAGMISDSVIGGTKASQGNIATTSTGGGGIYNDDGVVTMYDTHVDYNKNTSSGYAYGGGIYNCCYTIAMQGGSISHNVANGTSGGYGGGLYESSSYPVQLDGVSVVGNKTVGPYGEGAGIYNNDKLQLVGSKVNNNTITLTADGDYGYGAGISVEGQLQMVGGSLSGNQIVRGGTATYIYAYGAGFYEDDFAHFDGVKITGNKSLAGANGYAYGGGGYADYTDLFRHVTVSGNRASGYDAYGAGLYLDTDYEAHIAHATFAGNVNVATNYAEGAALTSEGDDLAMSDVSITGSKNTVSSGGMYGGAVYCYYHCTWDHVTIAKTTNSATDSSYPYIYGGAVYGDDYFKSSNVSVKTTNNATHGSGGYIYGGALYFTSGYSDEVSGLKVSGTTNTGGSGGYIYGGGLYAYSPLELNQATFSATHNKIGGAGAYVYGGAVYLYDQANLTKVKATDTIDNLPGDGSYVYGGVIDQDSSSGYWTSVNLSVVGATVTVGTNGYVYGGGIYQYSYASFDKMTIAKVTASATGPTSYVYGGGLYVYYQTNITNSTIANNHAKSPATTSGYGGYGGGVYTDDDLTLTNATIAGNTAGSGRGGGIYNYDYQVTVHNSIVSNNSGKNCASYSDTPAVTSAGHNLEKGTTCGFNRMGDLNASPGLGLLKNNGGFAPTMKPKAGSKAINHAANAGCPAVDERGIKRPQHVICDIGAVEVK
jgi:hypothetical protein